MEIVVFCVTDYIDKCEMNAVSFFYRNELVKTMTFTSIILSNQHFNF